MKDTISKRFTTNQAMKNHSSETSNNIEKEIEKFKAQFSKNEASNDSAWNSSVLRILFKNESFARKYRVKIEKFLKDLLEEGEEFIVYHPTHNYDEQEFEDNHQTFHIDKVHNESFETAKSSQNVPAYSSTYEDTLDCNDEEVVEKVEENKPSMVTCFNCLGDHHMKHCPVEIDRARINANKKEILLAGTTVRYHIEEEKNCLKPGVISDNLQKALGLNKNQLPQFIYHMRVIGYPPGWMNEAVFEESGLSLFDSDGTAISDDNCSSETGTLYDSTKFIDFPGFNTPVPEGFIDEWKALNMPPLQPHQQLTEALKSPNIIHNGTQKRKQKHNEDVDKKKHKNANNPCSSQLKVTISPNKYTTPERAGKLFEFRTPERTPKNGRHSMSISMSPGTPILEQGNPYQSLPAANKFAEGITEHLPFENLPDAVGSFEKMRGVISNVQKKLNNIKNS